MLFTLCKHYFLEQSSFKSQEQCFQYSCGMATELRSFAAISEDNVDEIIINSQLRISYHILLLIWNTYIKTLCSAECSVVQSYNATDEIHPKLNRLVWIRNAENEVNANDNNTLGLTNCFAKPSRTMEFLVFHEGWNEKLDHSVGKIQKMLI